MKGKIINKKKEDKKYILSALSEDYIELFKYFSINKNAIDSIVYEYDERLSYYANITFVKEDKKVTFECLSSSENFDYIRQIEYLFYTGMNNVYYKGVIIIDTPEAKDVISLIKGKIKKSLFEYL